MKKKGKDIIFLENSFIKNQLITTNKFYKEALLSISTFETLKGISDLSKWDSEHIFYNKIFLSKNDTTLALTKYCENNKIFVFKQLLDETDKKRRQQTHDKVLIKVLENIHFNTEVRQNDILRLYNGKEINFNQVTHKILYEEAVNNKSTLHHSEIKWAQKLDSAIPW